MRAVEDLELACRRREGREVFHGRVGQRSRLTGRLRACQATADSRKGGRGVALAGVRQGMVGGTQARAPLWPRQRESARGPVRSGIEGVSKDCREACVAVDWLGGGSPHPSRGPT